MQACMYNFLCTLLDGVLNTQILLYLYVIPDNYLGNSLVTLELAQTA